ncbi:MAG: glucose-6-phosphate dehydrogenase [Myxococcales bacterium]
MNDDPLRVRCHARSSESKPATETRAPEARYCARDPFTLIIFGASGDLAHRKLLPALFHLEEEGYLPEQFSVIGFSRTPLTDAAYRDSVRDSLKEAGLTPAQQSRLLASIFYSPGDNDDPAAFERLRRRIEEIEQARGAGKNRLAYLSVAPQFFATVVERLDESQILHPPGAPSWSRVIIEKPFGRDLESAQRLNHEIRRHLDESQIYRIDHYLGKETVQNLSSFRFGNAIFEPLFNQKYVEHVQITVAETLGMEGKRGAYYDHAGALRDMVQNHMLQLLTIIAMEPPSSMEADALRSEKVKVLRAIESMASAEAVAHNTVRGQYVAGSDQGKPIKGYHEELGVDPKSSTETYVAIKLAVDNWRWAGVPFYLRTGKRLAHRLSEIVVTFKQPPLRMFRNLTDDGNAGNVHPMTNVLLLRIQPDEGIGLTFAAKHPGMQARLDEVRMDFRYSDFHVRSPEAYERLLLDALRGDASLFTRSDEVESAWRFIHSIQTGWEKRGPSDLVSYRPLSEGPAEAARLFGGHGGFRPLPAG